MSIAKTGTQPAGRSKPDGESQAGDRVRTRARSAARVRPPKQTAPRTQANANGDANGPTERTPDTEGLQEPTATASALETKLAVVLDMRVAGRSQAEIADHFGVSERTVRRWEREAERRKISPLRDRDPFEFTRESLSDLAEFRADWLALYRKARDAGDHDSMAKCHKILTDIRREQDRVFALGNRHKNDGSASKQDFNPDTDPMIDLLRLTAQEMEAEFGREEIERKRQQARAAKRRREAMRGPKL